MFVHQSCNKFDQAMILSQLWVLEENAFFDVNLDEFDVESRSSLKSPRMMVSMNSSMSDVGKWLLSMSVDSIIHSGTGMS